MPARGEEDEARRAGGRKSRRGGAPSRPALCAILGGLLLLFTACEQTRQAKLEEVLRRSRLAPDRTLELEAPFLSDGDPDVRALAVWAIGDSQAPGALAAISPLATDPDPRVRVAVVKALCAIPEAGALDPVVALASDPEPPTRRASVRCLASAPAPPPGALARALLDADRETRAIALESLARRPDPGAVPQLLRVFEAGTPEDQLAAVAALRAARDPAALAPLERAAASRLPMPVRDAVEAAILDLRAAALEAQQAPPPAPQDGAGGPVEGKGPGGPAAPAPRESSGPAPGGPKPAPAVSPAPPAAKQDAPRPNGTPDVTPQ